MVSNGSRTRVSIHWTDPPLLRAASAMPLRYVEAAKVANEGVRV